MGLLTRKLVYRISAVGLATGFLLVILGIFTVSWLGRADAGGLISTVGSLAVVLFAMAFLCLLVLVGDKVTLKAVLVGLSVALLLGGLAIYPRRPSINDDLFLILCPTSIVTMGMDNAGLAEGIAAWVLVALTNAALYALIAVGLRQLWRTMRSRSLAS